MLYIDYLKNVHQCPFCNPSQRIFIENETGYLTFSLAPYHKHHLLVIPKQHITSFLDLTPNIDNDIDKLVEQGAKILKKLGYDDFTVLVRNGVNSGKSIDHLHYHIVPNTRIGNLDHEGNERQILTDEGIAQISADIKNAIDSINIET